MLAQNHKKIFYLANMLVCQCPERGQRARHSTAVGAVEHGSNGLDGGEKHIRSFEKGGS